MTAAPAHSCDQCAAPFDGWLDWRLIDGRVLCELCVINDPIDLAAAAIRIALGAEGRPLAGTERALLDNALTALTQPATN